MQIEQQYGFVSRGATGLTGWDIADYWFTGKEKRIKIIRQINGVSNIFTGAELTALN